MEIESEDGVCSHERIKQVAKIKMNKRISNVLKMMLLFRGRIALQPTVGGLRSAGHRRYIVWMKNQKKKKENQTEKRYPRNFG